MCTASRVSFLHLFSNDGYQKAAIFLKPVVKSVISLFSYEVFTFCSILFAKKLAIMCNYWIKNTATLHKILNRSTNITKLHRILNRSMSMFINILPHIGYRRNHFTHF